MTRNNFIEKINLRCTHRALLFYCFWNLLPGGSSYIDEASTLSCERLQAWCSTVREHTHTHTHTEALHAPDVQRKVFIVSSNSRPTVYQGSFIKPVVSMLSIIHALAVGMQSWRLVCRMDGERGKMFTSRYSRPGSLEVSYPFTFRSLLQYVSQTHAYKLHVCNTHVSRTYTGTHTYAFQPKVCMFYCIKVVGV